MYLSDNSYDRPSGRFRMIWTFLISAISIALANDGWLCMTESSQIQGNRVLACGIGIESDEAKARSRAAVNAKDEFNFLCGASDTCKDRQVNVDSGRTTCEKSGHAIKCYRLLVFIIGEKMPEKIAAREHIAREQARPPQTPQGTGTGANGDYTNDDFWRDMNNKYFRPLN